LSGLWTETCVALPTLFGLAAAGHKTIVEPAGRMSREMRLRVLTDGECSEAG